MYLSMFWRWVCLELFWEVRCYDNGPNFQFENFPPSHFCFFSTLSFCFDSCPLIIVCFLLPSTLYGVSQKKNSEGYVATPLRGNLHRLLNAFSVIRKVIFWSFLRLRLKLSRIKSPQVMFIAKFGSRPQPPILVMINSITNLFQDPLYFFDVKKQLW